MTGVILETNMMELGSLRRGKVRDIYEPPSKDYLYIVATDRISAFDSILPAGIPHKGLILTQIPAFCFKALRDIAPNHFIDSPDPNVMVAKKLKTYPVEVVVRGYLMGSAWRVYRDGKRDFNGTILPDGLVENQKLDEPIVTPATKAETGHDEDITDQIIIEKGLIPADIWPRIKAMSIELYSAGNSLAASNKKRRGVVFDTKFEWGYSEKDSAVLIDEVFTPDSSRIGEEVSYLARFNAGERPEWLDKEYARDFLKEQGWMGIDCGPVPEIPEPVVQETARRYQRGYEIMTGQKFEPPARPPTEGRMMANITKQIKKPPANS